MNMGQNLNLKELVEIFRGSLEEDIISGVYHDMHGNGNVYHIICKDKVRKLLAKCETVEFNEYITKRASSCVTTVYFQARKLYKYFNSYRTVWGLKFSDLTLICNNAYK